MSSVLEDILRDDLKENERKIIVMNVFDMIVGDRDTRRESLQRSKTLGKAKSLLEFYDLVRQVIDDYERRAGTPEKNKVIFTEEEPDAESETETITFSLIRREPGAYGQGAPFESRVRNLRPIIREDTFDPAHPDYRIVVQGYWYDNVVRFTPWARTNKAANRRAEWFEEMMEEYAWLFKLQGVNRTLFWGRQSDVVLDVSGNRWYGRPIDFFVRTEKLRVFSEKKIEEILIKVGTSRE